MTHRNASLVGGALAAILLAIGGEPPRTAQGQAFYPTWTQHAKTPPFPAGPPGRGWLKLAYDQVNRKTVLIGGSGQTYYNDIWWYDAGQDLWSSIEPSVPCEGIMDFVPPTRRDEHVVAYDSENHLYWMFGGSGFGCVGVERISQAGTNSLQIVDRSLPGNTSDFYKGWTVKALYSSGVGGSQAYVQAYDPFTKTLTLATPLSGLGPGMPYHVYPQRGGGTWYYSPASRSWASLTGPHWGYAGPSPISRLSPAFAYSPLHRAILMFGGNGGGSARTDTWVLDIVNKAWVQMLPANAPGSPPGLTQIQNAMVYDQTHDVFILFGGLLQGSEVSDTWAYSLASNKWTRMNPAVSPPARKQHQMAFDSANGVTVLYGGRQGIQILSDLWVYDYSANTWTQLSSSNAPGPTWLHSMVYDPDLQQSVLYKGTSVFTLELLPSPIAQSDLIVSGLSAPVTAGAGATISVVDTTRNQHATIGAGPSTTGFYLSTNNVQDPSDILLRSRQVPALAAGLSNTATTSLTLPAGLAKGTYYIIARADNQSAIAETNEDNNRKTSLAISIGPDLTVSALSVSVSGGAASITVTDTTKNDLSASPAGASQTRFYLSNNNTFDGADILLGERPVPALAPGATSSATTVQLPLPQGMATGIYYVIARADGANTIAERSETNNTRAVSFKVGPDLIVSAISARTTAVAGASITVNNTVKNQGSGSAGAFTVRFYRSSNTIFDGSDVALGSRVITSLGPGASNAATTSLPIPSDTAPGTYFIVAVADANFQITENTENNNAKASGSIQIEPD